MAIDPKRIAAQVALRILHVGGSTSSALETPYTDLVAGAGTLAGAEVNVTALVDAVLAIEAKLVDIVAGDDANPHRLALRGRTIDLAPGDEIPKNDQNGIEFIGTFIGANDSDTDYPLTQFTEQEFLRFQRASSGRYTTAMNKYKILNGRLYHTQDEAYVEGCSWSRTSARARFLSSSTGKSPLPVSFESIWVAETIAFLVQEDWLVAEADYYSRFAERGLMAIKNRNLDLPTLPTQQGAADAVKN